MSRYTREFRKETVQLLEISGKTVPELAQELGINPKSLYRWRSQYGGKHPVSRSNKAKDADDDLEAEVKRLRRENKVLQQERDILKKAISIFSRSQ
jgi:transposase